ncbi:class I SAM-dependent methyltransferase [Kroppenstedtia pulmonis]|uniref:Class I SAM-dependent methyltransferase n=1 Tax=Kroppenstedtia pulmonis TaxID=1380685 RepID=A0A7D4B0X4_9BACL|nr:class I SAM-dependent methyltransferase [Kroppenstedtia pulmonis]QKG83266.1 class I SAM-dependent methyltransferase [Kroppenstedtia pulmonis]
MSQKPEAPNWAAAAIVDDYTSFSKEGFWAAYHYQAAVGLQLSGLFKKSGRVLDIGCGPGWYTCVLKDLAPHINCVGVDLSTEMVEMARSVVKDENIQGVEFVEGNALKLPFPDESFDFVTSCFSFRFWGREIQSLREAYRVLKPDSLLYIADISGDIPQKKQQEILADVPDNGKEFVKRAMEMGLPTQEVDRILHQVGFDNVNHRTGGIGGYGLTDREVIEWIKEGFPIRKLNGLLNGKQWASELGKYWTHLYIRKNKQH